MNISPVSPFPKPPFCNVTLSVNPWWLSQRPVAVMETPAMLNVTCGTKLSAGRDLRPYAQGRFYGMFIGGVGGGGSGGGSGGDDGRVRDGGIELGVRIIW